MKMDLIKMLNNNFHSQKLEFKTNFKPKDESKENYSFDNKASDFKNKFDSAKNNLDDNKKVNKKDKSKDSEDEQIKEALEFLNSLQNNDLSDKDLNNKTLNDKDLLDINKIINELYNIKPDKNILKDIKISSKTSKDDFMSEMKVLETLKDLTSEIKNFLSSKNQNTNVKEDILNKLKGMEENLHLNNKDLLSLIKDNIKFLEKSIDKSDLKAINSKLQFTEDFLCKLVNEQVKDNPKVLNDKEIKSFKDLFVDIRNNKEDKLSFNNKNDFQNNSNLEKINEKVNLDAKTVNNSNLNSEDNKENAENNFETKEDKLLNDIIKGKDSSSKKLRGPLFNSMITNQSNNDIKLDAVGATVKINPQNPVEGVIKTVKYMNVNGLKELTVKINPLELGEMNIKLSMNAEGMKATISANNKDTYNLLNANLNDLKTSLSNQNIKVVQVFVNLNNDNQGGFHNEFNEANLGNNFSNGENRNQSRQNKNGNVLNESNNDSENNRINDDSLINAFA